MTLKEIFKKPIDRDMPGVIMADATDSLMQEVEEYVITRELEKHLGNFLEAYNNYQSANGVWISGFFGSGKSHLLKMLSLVLEDDIIEDTKVTDIFLDKPIFNENTFLKNDIEKASSLPSKSILFNIDAKSAVSTTDQSDAILSVFVKVFDEFCGYSPKNPYVAQFERDLDEEGLLQDFKNEVENLTEKEWVKVRERRSRFGDSIDLAYEKITGQKSEDILKTYSDDYSLSIEDFADRVKNYISNQESNFRLNFFVDEVGQYIAGNTTLMLNLQSIAETLNTQCKGRSWIIVTSQEEMKDVVGEMDRQQSFDFSKIQDRFANRMNLTSQDVHEVIQKRLLLKNDAGSALLTNVYKDQKNNFDTLFTFLDGAQTYRGFNDKEHFTYCYPFIPYQFALFQEAMQGLSAHNAFQGRHSSVGERSMLDVFQNVANQVSEYNIGELATFDLMYEGVRGMVKSQIQNRILLAENNLENEFSIQILKALFLVKYVKGVKSTIRNICVLMTNSFDQDLSLLKSTVEESLLLLEQQTYIKRKDNQYEFLTDEEKDVEEEIKSTSVEKNDLTKELNDIIFGRILKDPKIKYQKNNQDYKFNQKIDGELQGSNISELSINFVTSLNSDAGNSSSFLMQSMGLDELFIVMPPSTSLVHDLYLQRRTYKYIKQYDSSSNDTTTNKIVAERGQQNELLKGELVEKVKELIGQSDIIINGEKLDNITSQDAKLRIIAGFNSLINNAYPNLEMIPFDTVYTDATLHQILESTQGEINTSLSNAEQGIFSFIQLQSSNAFRLSYKALIDNFEKKPFGWQRAAIHCLTANLFVKAKIELRKDSSILEGRELKSALQSNNQWPNVIIQLQADFSPKEVRGLKTFYEEFFNKPAVSSDARNLATETKNAFNDLASDLRQLSNESSNFPFIITFNQSITEIESKKDKETSWYFKDFKSDHQDLISLKTETIDPIQSFLNGTQKEIYRDAESFINNNSANKSHLKGDEFQLIEETLSDENCYKGNAMQTLKANLKKCNEEISSIIKSKRDSEITKAESHKARYESSDGYEKLGDVQKLQVDNAYKNLFEEINKADAIDSIPSKLGNFENNNYSELLDLLTPVDPDQPKKVTEYINTVSIEVPYTSPLISSKEDVEKYIELLKTAYLKEIKAGKKIKL